jgi:hypothetical protein
MDSTTCDDETVVARHETMAMMAVHLPRIQNLVVGDAPPSPIAGVPFGRSGRGSLHLAVRNRQDLVVVPDADIIIQ